MLALEILMEGEVLSQNVWFKLPFTQLCNTYSGDGRHYRIMAQLNLVGLN